MQDSKWRFRKLATNAYPIVGPQASASPVTVAIELKNFEQVGTIARMFVRIVGNIIVAGAAPGVATGRDNPEALLVQMTLKTTPDLGVNIINNLSARGLIRYNLFERGYLIKAATVPDTAATVPVDFSYEVNFRNPLAIKPVEYSLPLALFSSAQLQLQFGGKEQLFSVTANTWDLTGVRIEIWADMDMGIAGTFHMTCFDERTFQNVTATQSDFPLLNMPPGYVYTGLLLRTEGALALVNNILNSWTVQGAGRVWTPQGDVNALQIQRWNRETNLTDPAVVQTGLFFINALRDGMLSNAIDSLDSQLDMKTDVTFQAGTVPNVLTLTSKRCIPNALQLAGVVAAQATTTTGTSAASQQ
jgi:hypothetical protein